MSLPFCVGEGPSEDATMRGRISYGGASLTLELSTDLGGRDLAAPRKVIIGIEELAGCKFRRGLLADRLHLRTASIAAFGGVPGATLDVMTLKFAKSDRAAVEAFVDRLASVVVERPPAPLPSTVKVFHPFDATG